MTDTPNITARANAIFAMLSADEKDQVKAKAASGRGAPPSVMTLALELARQETKSGARTAKIKLTKALIAVGKSL